MSITDLATHHAARDRVISLVSRLPSNDLDAVADVLTTLIETPRTGARGFTRAEMTGLAELGVPETALSGTPRVAARLRSAMTEQALGRDALAATDVAQILRVSPARVRQRAAEGSVIAQRTRTGWRFPAFQFPERRELPGWPAVARACVPGTPLLLLERVLTRSSARLVHDDEELSPFDWLAAGLDPDTAAAAVDDALHRLA